MPRVCDLLVVHVDRERGSGAQFSRTRLEKPNSTVWPRSWRHHKEVHGLDFEQPWIKTCTYSVQCRGGRLFPQSAFGGLHPACCTLQARFGSRNHSCGLGTRAHVSETSRIMPQPPALCRRTLAYCTMDKLATPPCVGRGCCQDAARARPLGICFVSFPSHPGSDSLLSENPRAEELCPPGQYHRHLGHLKVAVDNTRALEA